MLCTALCLVFIIFVILIFILIILVFVFVLFFFNDTATTEIYTLSLHDALPISRIVEKAYNSLGNIEKKIFISHTPPYGILDRTGSGIRAGSKALRNFIRDADMELVICGHVHEAKGIEKWQGKLIVNPGPRSEEHTSELQSH